MAVGIDSPASPTLLFSSSLACPTSLSRSSLVERSRKRRICRYRSSVAASPFVQANALKEPPLRTVQEQTSVGVGLPREGQMAEETPALHNNFKLSVGQENPRHYVADISQAFNVDLERGELQPPLNGERGERKGRLYRLLEAMLSRGCLKQFIDPPMDNTMQGASPPISDDHKLQADIAIKLLTIAVGLSVFLESYKLKNEGNYSLLLARNVLGFLNLIFSVIIILPIVLCLRHLSIRKWMIPLNVVILFIIVLFAFFIILV